MTRDQNRAEHVARLAARNLQAPDEVAEMVPAIPADTRAVVREALKSADAFWAAHHHAVAPALNSPWYKVRAALAALDAAPAEGETVGYSAINRAGMITGTWQPHQKTLARRWLRDAERGSRIVRLVAEPGHE